MSLSTEQTYLISVVGMIGFLAVPSFFLGESSAPFNPGGNHKQSNSNQSKNHVFNPTSVPETRFSLAKTTEKERQQIRQSWKVDINTAGENQLLTLPKVGPKTAKKIISFRREEGKFYRTEGLTRVSGIGQKNVKDILPHVTVEEKYRNMEPPESESKKVNVNSANQSKLEQLPGIGPAYAERIMEYREEKGAFNDVEELENVNGIGPKTIESLRDKVTL